MEPDRESIERTILKYIALNRYRISIMFTDIKLIVLENLKTNIPESVYKLLANSA